MKKEKEKEIDEKNTKAKETKATSGGGKNKNDGGLVANELKAGNSADKGGRSGGKGA